MTGRATTQLNHGVIGNSRVLALIAPTHVDWLCMAPLFRQPVGVCAHSRPSTRRDGVRRQVPDASNLLLPTLGIIDPRDPRFVSTVDAYERLWLKMV